MNIKSVYYHGKIMNLFNKIFIETSDARDRFINCEKQFTDAYFASGDKYVPSEIQTHWEKIWTELNKKEQFVIDNGKRVYSSFHQTIKSKRNKTLEKYLLFILEEHGRLLKEYYTTPPSKFPIEIGSKNIYR